MYHPTETQQEIIRFLADWYADGVTWSPSTRSIAAAVGRSNSTVHDNLHKLKDAGLVCIPVPGVYLLAEVASDE